MFLKTGFVILTALLCTVTMYSQSQTQPRETPFGTSAVGKEWKGEQVVETRFGYVLWNSIWPKGKVPIAVCWEDPGAADAKLQDVVRDAVVNSWQKESKIRFTGWGKCASGSLGIRIQVASLGPHVKALGYYLDGRPNGMVLNFDFSTWSKSCQTKKDFCVWAIAVHEFGHAIGFAHEQNRKDAPPECQAERQGTDGDYKVTAYDAQSVMNYCNPNWNNGGTLSAGDVEAVRKIYGAP